MYIIVIKQIYDIFNFQTDIGLYLRAYIVQCAIAEVQVGVKRAVSLVYLTLNEGVRRKYRLDGSHLVSQNCS